MADERKTVEYRPPWAPHVVGRYPERLWDKEASAWVEQKIIMTCEHPGCGGSFQTTCSSGMTREHVNNFAKSHVHRDVFKDPFPGKAPGEP